MSINNTIFVFIKTLSKSFKLLGLLIASITILEWNSNYSFCLSKGIEEKTYPNWINFPINSPLENSDLSGLSPIIDLLNSNLLLHFIMLYLIFMVLLIFTSKLLIEKKFNLEGIKKIPLGYYIHFLLTKLINIWKLNSNLWIYFILINLFIFTFFSSYSLYTIIISLNSL